MAGDDEFDATKTNGSILMTHIAYKGAQAGSGLGAIGGPMFAFFRKKNILSAIPKGSFYGVLLMTPLVTLGGYYRMSNLDKAGIQDRDYKLHYNVNQNRLDRLSGIGGAIGAVVGPIFLRPMGLITATGGGMALGILCGIAGHTLTAEKKQGPNAMLEEIKSGVEETKQGLKAIVKE